MCTQEPANGCLLARHINPLHDIPPGVLRPVLIIYSHLRLNLFKVSLFLSPTSDLNEFLCLPSVSYTRPISYSLNTINLNMWRSAQTLKLLTAMFSTHRHFLPVKLKYVFQHPVFKNPHSAFSFNQIEMLLIIGRI
jgi:hypothetical protein